jgi:hypothetical protein
VAWELIRIYRDYTGLCVHTTPSVQARSPYELVLEYMVTSRYVVRARIYTAVDLASGFVDPVREGLAADELDLYSCTLECTPSSRTKFRYLERVRRRTLER